MSRGFRSRIVPCMRPGSSLDQPQQLLPIRGLVAGVVLGAVVRPSGQGVRFVSRRGPQGCQAR